MFRKSLFAVAALGLSLIAGSASASCLFPQEDGNWRNVDRSTRSITTTNIDFTCQDVILKGQRPGPSWHLRLWGSCSPTDCDWGKKAARKLDSGWIYAYYDQGFAKRHVYARMSGADRLRVYIRTDFSDPARADYNSDNTFVRN